MVRLLAASFLLAALQPPPFVLSQRILYENDKCGYGGTCAKVENCPEAIAMLRKGQKPPVCNFIGARPVVCCLKPNLPGQKSKQKCEEYAKYVFKEEKPLVLLPNAKPELVDKCGVVEEPLIVGGVNAKPLEFPHMVMVGYGDPPKYLCGGSLISDRFVLSAAHCSEPGPQWGPAKWAKVGELDTDTAFEDAKPDEIRIKRRIDHPEYRKERLYHDISLYELERPVRFSEYVRPICLDTGNPPVTDRTAIATGWGHTEWGGRGSNSLKKVRIFFRDISLCNETYKSSIGRQLPNGIVPQTQLCAGEEGKDTCQGDSGGPLQVPISSPYCMYKQVGVTSFGKACGNNFPGVYTRVSNYISWIEGIVFK